MFSLMLACCVFWFCVFCCCLIYKFIRNCANFPIKSVQNIFTKICKFWAISQSFLVALPMKISRSWKLGQTDKAVQSVLCVNKCYVTNMYLEIRNIDLSVAPCVLILMLLGSKNVDTVYSVVYCVRLYTLVFITQNGSHGCIISSFYLIVVLKLHATK